MAAARPDRGTLKVAPTRSDDSAVVRAGSDGSAVVRAGSDDSAVVRAGSDGSAVVRAGRDSVVRHLGADDRSSTRVRLVDGALRCLARQGIAKTTVDDIAREAGLSRATAYRAFPRGKESILAAVVETEVARLFSSLAVAMGEANDLEDLLVAGMVESARQLRTHAALSYLLAYEPGAILPYLTFAELDRLLLVAGDLAAPFFGRWLEPDQATRAAEWAVRIVLAYCSDQTPATDLTDPLATRALVRAFVLPGILALRVDAPGPPRRGDAPGPTRPATLSDTTATSIHHMTDQQGGGTQ